MTTIKYVRDNQDMTDDGYRLSEEISRFVDEAADADYQTEEGEPLQDAVEPLPALLRGNHKFFHMDMAISVRSAFSFCSCSASASCRSVYWNGLSESVVTLVSKRFSSVKIFTFLPVSPLPASIFAMCFSIKEILSFGARDEYAATSLPQMTTASSGMRPS